jgi:hypothetical protein
MLRKEVPAVETMRAERLSLLLARQLPGAVVGYYKLVDESSEEQIPASRVLKIEQLEPLGLAVQMYCLFLRTLEVDSVGVDRMMAAAWRTLELTPETRDDIVAQARKYYEEMRAYQIFREASSVQEMVAERCESIFPVMQQAPELQGYVKTVSNCFNVLQQFAIA